MHPDQSTGPCSTQTRNSGDAHVIVCTARRWAGAGTFGVQERGGTCSAQESRILELRTISSTGRRSVPIFCLVSLCPAAATRIVHQIALKMAVTVCMIPAPCDEAAKG